MMSLRHIKHINAEHRNGNTHNISNSKLKFDDFARNLSYEEHTKVSEMLP